MRNNKAILDEAARSVRQTFIGSVAGTVGMLAVVGAAGAYGMPEKLTAHVFTLALSKLNLSPKGQRTIPTAERVVKVAESVTRGDATPVGEPAPPQAPVVRTMPEFPVEPAPAPVSPLQGPAAAPPETSTASAAPILPVESVVTVEPVIAAEPKAAELVPAVEPAPTRTASIAPVALPNAGDDRLIVPAPLVFETPKPDLIPPLAEMAKIEPVEPAAAAEPAKSVTTTAAIPQAKPVEPVAVAVLPKTMRVLPLPKPPLSPAQRLDLHGKDYDKAEKCLAQAVYFEARDQALRGQQAVAQVVLNRVFSPYYPKDICSVVYQNAHRHLSCQFTFACDGKPETVRERGAWAQANRIAKQTLAAKVWLPEVAKATHYHASYVHPRWVREMKVMVRYGIHTFYRPRNWGDGADEPHWGTASNSAKPVVNAVAIRHHAAPPHKRLAFRRI